MHRTMSSIVKMMVMTEFHISIVSSGIGGFTVLVLTSWL